MIYSGKYNNKIKAVLKFQIISLSIVSFLVLDGFIILKKRSNRSLFGIFINYINHKSSVLSNIIVLFFWQRKAFGLSLLFITYSI